MSSPRAPFPVSPATASPWALASDILIARRLPREAIAHRQRERLVSLLQAALRAPGWARRLEGMDPVRTALHELPVLGKREALQQLDTLVADPAVRRDALQAWCDDPTRVGSRFLDRYWVWTSSGSTGEPALYVQDEAAMAVYDALEATRRDSPRPWLRALDPLYWSERMAFVGATGGHFASHVSMQRLRQVNPWLVNWQCMNILQPVQSLCAELDDFAPTLLATYPTAAVMLADEALAGRLACRPAEIWTGGETLTPAMRAHVGAAFGAPVRDSYGASEFLPIAWECAHGRLHVNADWVILEPVDRHRRPVPPGHASHSTLLTNLANHVQPVIRRDLGDRITLDDSPCSCGCALPVVTVQGRCDDAVHLPGRAGRTVTLLPLAVTAVLEEEAHVFDFRLRQTGPSELQLGLGPVARADAGAGDRSLQAVHSLLRRLQAAPVQVTLEDLSGPELQRSGKCQRIVALHG